MTRDRATAGGSGAPRPAAAPPGAYAAPDVRWARLEALFDAATSLAEEDRAAWLAAACPDDPALRAEVAQMLIAHHRADGILDRGVHGRAHGAASGAPDAPEPPDALGARLAAALDGRYAIERELGRGGMGVVFLAHERKHARRVVLKVLRPEVGAQLGSGRFAREVRIAARLAHPNIVGLIDSGEAGGLLYYVMPYVEGETLRARLARPGACPTPEALALLRDVADALAYAHREGVVHRDLKPENVLCAGEHAFLLDFGIAKLTTPGTEDGHVTRQGALVGTPAYMAPEQHAGDARVDHRADLYAWGVLAVELLSGRRAGTPSDAHDALQHTPLPQPLAELVAACLAFDPADRPADAAVLLAALAGAPAATRSPVPELVPAPVAEANVGEDTARPTPTLTTPTTTPERAPTPVGAARPRRRRLARAAAGAAVLAVTLAGLLRWRAAGAPSATGLENVVPVGPVVVGALTNETGDPALDAWGRMAGDWITQGLQEAGHVDVVPWPNALGASERLRSLRASGQAPDAVAHLGHETGARTAVTGAYYLAGDSLRFQVAVTDARTGRLLGAPPPVSVARDSGHLAVRALRDRLMAAVAIWSDERLAALPDLARRPPTFAAYQAFDAALQQFVAQQYAASAPEFRRAYALDTTFLTPLLYAATAYWNADAFAAADTVSRALRSRRGALGAHDRAWADFLDASLAGDGPRALAAIRRAAALAPATRASYTLARVALEMGRPREALAALDRLDPDRGDMRGWSSYWTQRAHALHLLGAHERERDAARAMRARFPDRQVGLVFEARAVAALGHDAELDALFAAGRASPPTTYWSLGAAMVVAGQELVAHGHAAAGGRRLEQGIAWLRAQLKLTPGERGHRYWLAIALYGLGRWPEAEAALGALARDHPDRLRYRGLAALAAARAGAPDAERLLGAAAPHERGTHAAFRARLAALRGDRRAAAALFADAVRDGVETLPWLHASAHADLALFGAERAGVPGTLGGAADPGPAGDEPARDR